MSKYGHIKDLKCFPQVAAVIGNASAQRELWKVVHNRSIRINSSRFDSNFSWARSPQGSRFWSCIDLGINPYKAS